MLSEDYGGRVELAKAYYKALTASVKKHFKGNGVIASMQHCNDFMLLGTQTICLGRVGKLFNSHPPSNYSNINNGPLHFSRVNLSYPRLYYKLV